jgi:sporulation protein YlmC with PRC-barrel domain
VREFWSKVVRIGSLKTSCNVPGGPVYKVAYASQLLEAPLYDGRGELLGTVREAILAPESGKIGFYVVQPARGEGWVMVRLGATNIPKEALTPKAALRLVLLTDPQMFWEAPRLTTLEEAENFTMQGKMLQYWDR